MKIIKIFRVGIPPTQSNFPNLLFVLSLFLLILCLHVNENHEHVQSSNPNTTKPLPGRHNNNKNRDKTNNKLGKIDWVCGIPTLNIFMVFINKQEDIRLMETERNKCFC